MKTIFTAPRPRNNLVFHLAMMCVFIVGAFLRLQSVQSQILVDDEWQNLIPAIRANYVDLLTHFNAHDNASPPLAMYNLALYDTFGWTEFSIRFPAILAGLLSLILLPYCVRRLFNERTAIIFSCFVAIAPFLIFYSHYARAYECAMLLCFLALFLIHQWLATGQLGYAAGYILAGAFAVYVHLMSLVPVFTPLMFAICFKVAGEFRLKTSVSRQVVVPLKAVLFVVGTFILTLVPLFLPVMKQSAGLPWHMGSLTLDSIVDAASLMSGTSNMPLSVVFLLSCLVGQILLFKRNSLLGWIVLSSIGSSFVVLLISRPLGLGVGTVLMRYMIVSIPFALAMVAFAIDWMLTRLRRTDRIPPVLPVLAVVSFIVLLFIAGPLPAQLALSSNFTNHSAFQASYAPQTWERSHAKTVYPAFTISEDQISPFYHVLAERTDIREVIEYPFDICDYNDLFYYYQHFHKKRVLAGYCADRGVLGYAVAPSSERDGTPFSIGMLTLDEILARVADRSKLKFQNLIDVTNPSSIAVSSADVLILHKYIEALKTLKTKDHGGPAYGTVRVYYRSVSVLRVRLEGAFGPPIYEDRQIVCFGIKKYPDAMH